MARHFPESKDWAAKQFFELVSLAYRTWLLPRHQVLQCDQRPAAAFWLGASSLLPRRRITSANIAVVTALNVADAFL